MLNKESIIEMLRTDKRAVARALVVLYNRQTDDEKSQEGTRHLNGRGFRPCHARMGSSMAKQFNSVGFLTDKQISYWRVLDRKGNMRIGIYAGQLLEEAELKAKRKPPLCIQTSLPMYADFKMHNVGPRGTTTPAEATAIGGAFVAMAGLAIPAREHSVEVARDFGNDMERKLVLTEMLNDVMDSDDPTIVDPIAKEIAELDAYWNKLRKI